MIEHCPWCELAISDTRLGLVLVDKKSRHWHSACATSVLGMVNLPESEWRLIEKAPTASKKG